MSHKKTRNRSKNKRSKSKSSSQSTTDKNIAKTQSGQSLVALTAVNDAFAFAVGAIGKKDSFRAGRKLRALDHEENARRLDADAEQIIESGREQANEVQKRGSQDASSLRAKLATQGIQVDFGTGAEAVEDILKISGADASAIKINAFRHATNNLLQSSDIRSRSNLERIAGKKAEADVLLGGGLNTLRSLTQGVAQADGFSSFFTK